MPELTPHPDKPSAAVDRIEAGAERLGASRLRLRYRAAGRIVDVAVPPAAAPERTDDLWRRTCFEAFVRSSSGEGYLELNLSPSTQWAAYRFAGYRDGMAPAPIPAPTVTFSAGPDACELEAEVDLSGLPELGGAWRVGLTAVIETQAGATSLWALRHAPERPDFHHPDCFVLDLPEAGRP